jgi:hypothetical protein
MKLVRIEKMNIEGLQDRQDINAVLIGAFQRAKISAQNKERSYRDRWTPQQYADYVLSYMLKVLDNYTVTQENQQEASV